MWIAGAIGVLGAIGVVAAKTPVHSVLALVVNILALAALFLSLHAEFVALIQVIIYAGAIMVLFLFVIALLTASRDPMERPTSRLRSQSEFGLMVGLGVGLLIIAAVVRGVGSGAFGALVDVAPEFGTAAEFGKVLLTTHIFPFELTAFVLLAAVIGVVVLVGRRKA